MISLNSVHLSSENIESTALSALGASHGLTPDQSRTYARFFELKSVARHAVDLDAMLSSALQGALAQMPDATNSHGQLVYCKTQTHNTLADRNWLRRFADVHGLERWETSAVSMTSCASAIVFMHFVRLCEAKEPLIILTGEKAFHPSFARLPVGLLAELPTAAVFNGGWQGWSVRGTSVRHLARFYQNPDAMDVTDRRALQSNYVEALIAFIADSLMAYAPLLHEDFVFLPHNLNLPVTGALLRHFGWAQRTFQGDVRGMGHAYCSDIFLNLAEIGRSGKHFDRPGAQIFVLAAGTGVTFASCLIERTSSA
jgi:hypothetical protein